MSRTTIQGVALVVAGLTLGTLFGAARPWGYLATGPAATPPTAKETRAKPRGPWIDLAEEARRRAELEDPAVTFLRNQLLTTQHQLSEARLSAARRKLEEDLDEAKDKEARKKAIDRFMRKAREAILAPQRPGPFNNP